MRHKDNENRGNKIIMSRRRHGLEEMESFVEDCTKENKFNLAFEDQLGFWPMEIYERQKE